MSTFNKDYEKEEKEEVIKLNPTKKEVETKLKLKYILCIIIVCLVIIAYQYYKELTRVENEIQEIQENKISETKVEEETQKETDELSNIENVIEDMDVVIDNGHIVNNDVDVSKMTVDEVTNMLIQDATNIVENPNTYFDVKTDEYMQDATKKLEDAKNEFLNSVDENNLTEKEEKALQMLNAVEEMLYEYNY